MRRLSPVLATGLALVGLLYACTGDDPAAPIEGASSSSGGSSSGGSSSGGSSGGTSGSSGINGDAGPGSCLGKAFTSISPIKSGKNADAGISTPWIAETLRLSSSNDSEIFFAASLDDSQGTSLFRATWNNPVIGDDAIEIVESFAGKDSTERSPTVARSVTSAAVFLVWEHVNLAADQYNLRINARETSTPFVFGTFELLDMKGGDVNERGPWLAGPTTKAIYWSRSLNGTAYRVIRSEVTLDESGTNNGKPTFGAAKFISLACPGGEKRNCDTPVVTPDEATMLFSTNDIGGGTRGVYQNVQAFETVLDKDHNQVGAPIPHPEVEKRFPTWISDNGCEAVFGNESGSVYAKR